MQKKNATSYQKCNMRCDKSETYQKWNMFFDFMILLAKTNIIANPEKKDRQLFTKSITCSPI